MVTLIEQRRQAAQLSMREMARRTCLPLTTFWKISSGKREARMSEIARIAVALGCTPGDLIPPLTEDTSHEHPIPGCPNGTAHPEAGPAPVSGNGATG